MFNCESEDGTWEIIHHDETKTVRLVFWDYENPGDYEKEVLKKKVELELSYEQYQSLLDFSKRMNAKAKED